MMASDEIHISEADAASNLSSLSLCTRAGTEMIIEDGISPVAVLSSPVPSRHSIAECIAVLQESSPLVMDESFAQDVEAAIASQCSFFGAVEVSL